MQFVGMLKGMAEDRPNELRAVLETDRLTGFFSDNTYGIEKVPKGHVGFVCLDAISLLKIAKGLLQTGAIALKGMLPKEVRNTKTILDIAYNALELERDPTKNAYLDGADRVFPDYTLYLPNGEEADKNALPTVFYMSRKDARKFKTQLGAVMKFISRLEPRTKPPEPGGQ